MDRLPPEITAREQIRLGLLLLPIALLYALAALRNHALYGTAFDLAIFDQALWHASRFETPTSTIRQVPSIFGDHVHPAILLMVPLYWLGLGARGLLALQPFLVLSAAFPILRFARRRLAPTPALLVALAYAASWGVGKGFGLDWHEFALTAPALAWVIERWDARDERGFWIAALALLLTKEDQSLTLVMFGALALLRRDGWRPALAPVLVGAAWFLLATRVVAPQIAGRPYEHWLYAHIAPTPPALLLYLLTHPVRVAGLLVSPGVKLALWYRTIGTFALLPLLSPYVLLAVPSLLSRLLSNEAIHWEPSYHYSMPVMVALACAAADALGRLEARSPRLALAGAAIALLVSAGMNRGALQIEQLLRPRTSPALARELDELLDRIPPNASVTADNYLAPHLSARDWILFADDRRRVYRTEYIVLDPAVPPGSPRLAARMAEDRDYELIGSAGPTRLYRRRPGIQSDLPPRPRDLPTVIPETRKAR